MGLDLPFIFLMLMALAILAYVILDGFDLGVGMLLPLARRDQHDLIVASIGPFWDANETWLVMGVGVLLVAFPRAHGVILSSLYIPVALMLTALIVRGTAYEFRTKAAGWHKELWNHLFFAGSLGMAIAQGYMLAAVVTGFQSGPWYVVFGFLVGLGLAGGYVLLGATWAHAGNGWLFTAANGGWEYPAFLTLAGVVVGNIEASATTRPCASAVTATVTGEPPSSW